MQFSLRKRTCFLVVAVLGGGLLTFQANKSVEGERLSNTDNLGQTTDKAADITAGIGNSEGGKTKDCVLREAKFRKKGVNEPVFLSAFHASGGEATRKLVEALTTFKSVGPCKGKKHCGDAPYTPYDYLLYKHHYPAINSTRYVTGKRDHEGEWAPLAGIFQKVILQVRNPLDAIAGVAMKYSNSAESHQVQLPHDDWKKWRDRYFTNELYLWKEFIEYWTDSYSMHQDTGGEEQIIPLGNEKGPLIVLMYEELIDKPGGGEIARLLASFLSPSLTKEGKKRLEPPDNIHCVWEQVMLSNGSPKFGNENDALLYTRDQVRETQLILDLLSAKYRTIAHIFERYREHSSEREE
jgi:hypothetical protein